MSPDLSLKPAVARPFSTTPLLDVRTFGPRRINRLEHRDYARRPIQCDVWLIDSQTGGILRCKTNDICDAGLHATAPIGFGLAVGQRYEVRIARTDGVAVKASPGHLGKSLGYATVIRTELHVAGDRHDRVGFAIRFDSPQLLPV